MKNRNSIFLLLCAVLFSFCASADMTGGDAEGGMGITAKGGIGRREAAPPGPMYSGDGGGNIWLAILAPEVQGDVPDYLKQGVLCV
jgi:hypothetical protein